MPGLRRGDWVRPVWTLPCGPGAAHAGQLPLPAGQRHRTKTCYGQRNVGPLRGVKRTYRRKQTQFWPCLSYLFNMCSPVLPHLLERKWPFAGQSFLRSLRVKPDSSQTVMCPLVSLTVSLRLPVPQKHLPSHRMHRVAPVPTFLHQVMDTHPELSVSTVINMVSSSWSCLL